MGRSFVLLLPFQGHHVSNMCWQKYVTKVKMGPRAIKTEDCEQVPTSGCLRLHKGTRRRPGISPEDGHQSQQSDLSARSMRHAHCLTTCTDIACLNMFAGPPSFQKIGCSGLRNRETLVSNPSP
jgi:hypothetical protein